MIELTSRGARVVTWLYFSTIVVLALWTLDDVREPAPTILGLVLFAIGCVVLSRDTHDVLSLEATLFSVAVWPVVTLLISWQVERGGHSQWYAGAATVSLFFICLRGRIVWAWIGFALVSGAIALWGATSELAGDTALSLIGRQLPILIVGTLFAIGLRRTTENIVRLTASTSARAATEAADLAATAERDRRLAELDTFVTPLLTQLVEGTPLTDDDRRGIAVAEAQLRDGLRARSLSVPLVVDAARRARLRGVDVVLLDDSDPTTLDPADLESVIAQVAEVLDEAEDGRVVARLLPPGRPDVATVLLDGSTSRRDLVIAAIER